MICSGVLRPVSLLFWTIALIGSVCAQTPAVHPVAFRPAPKLDFKTRNYPTNANPQSVAVADLNQDGKLDFVQVNYNGGGAGTVSVFLGRGDGTFQPDTDYPVGNGPVSVAVADLNGDGALDLAVANDTSSSVSILFGNGDGTFQASQDFAAGSFPHWIAIGDLNGDKKPDLVVTNEGQDSVGIFLNEGDGTFGAMRTFPVAKEPYPVVIGDFNHDGKLDLAVGGYYSGVVSILLGNGDGTFQPHVDYSTGSCPAAMVLADFNADGNLDLATANYNNGQSGTVSILLGNGDGTFSTHVDYQVGLGPDGLAIGDFNGDGVPDLAVADLIANSLSLLLGNGDGTFQSPVDFNTGAFPNGIGIGDFTGSRTGSDDLIVTNDLDATATAFLNLAATSVGLTSSPNPSKRGQAVTFTATVKAAVQNRIPTGNVTFSDGLQKLAAIQLSNGVAQFTTNKLAEGKHRITAFYSGDGSFNPNKSAPLTQRVNP